MPRRRNFFFTQIFLMFIVNLTRLLRSVSYSKSEEIILNILITGEVKLTGKGKYSEDIKEVNTTLLLLTDNYFVSIDQGWSEFFIFTDMEYIILYVLSESLLNNYDYIVNLKTETAAATWKARRNSLEYKKIMNIINEQKTEWRAVWSFLEWDLSQKITCLNPF